MMRRLLACAMGAAMALTTTEPTGAQVRSLDEVKKEVLRRAGKINPFGHIRPDDAQRIVNSLTSLDRDHWAQAWCKVGLDYEAQGDARAKAGASGKELADIYFLASDYCRIGRYPVANTPGKKEAYHHSVRIFRKAARHFANPLQIVEVPFEGKKLVGYLTIPKGTSKPPVVMHWGGVDGWKEDREGQNRFLHRAGLATLTVDMPGTGEHPTLLRRSGRDQDLFGLARPSRLPQRHRRQPHRRLGRKFWRLLGGAARLCRGQADQGRRVPRRQCALRLPARLARSGLHHRRRHLSVRRREPLGGARAGDGHQDRWRNSSTPCRSCH